MRCESFDRTWAESFPRYKTQDVFIIWPRKIEGKWFIFETVECDLKQTFFEDMLGGHHYSWEVIEYRKKWKLKDKYININE